ncbi:MAG: pyrimidine dimer DNA glycosylase/endonuclease V [Candidatus Marinimicrobia bacterium]|nr:pyrimidine dimer DNA glycosylase/endonuclease V [Candidatus Neomarinimicrobiota bacterium]
MNIFVLDMNIEKCARYHCDQHVVKMILESTQIVCTALNKKGFVTPYRSTHVKHPCVLWAGISFDNLQWLIMLARALNCEYKYRYRTSREHVSIRVLDEVKAMRFASSGLTEFAQAMPEKYKVPGDPVRAYRDFYIGEKLGFAKWTRRKRPVWIEEHFRKQAPEIDIPTMAAEK